MGRKKFKKVDDILKCSATEIEERVNSLEVGMLQTLEDVLNKYSAEINSDGNGDTALFILACVGKRKRELAQEMTNAFIHSRMANDSATLFHYGIIAMYSLIEKPLEAIRENLKLSSAKTVRLYNDRYKSMIDAIQHSSNAVNEFIMSDLMNEYLDEYGENYFSTKVSVAINRKMQSEVDSMQNSIKKEVNKYVKRWEKEDEKNGVKREYRKFNSWYVSSLCVAWQLCGVMYQHAVYKKEVVSAHRKHYDGRPFVYDVEVFKKMGTAIYLLIEEQIGGKALMERSGVEDFADKALDAVSNSLQEKDKEIKKAGFSLMAEAQMDYLNFYMCKMAFETAIKGAPREAAKTEVMTTLMKENVGKNPKSMWMLMMKDIRRIIKDTEAEPEDTEDYFYELRDTITRITKEGTAKMPTLDKLYHGCIRYLARMEAWKDDDVVALEREALMEIVEKNKKPTPKGGRRKNDGREEESTKEPSLCAAV